MIYHHLQHSSSNMPSKQPQSSVDDLLDNINASLESSIKSVDNINGFLDDYGENYPDTVTKLIKSMPDDQKSHLNGLSLLSLKNSALLGYLDSLTFVINSRLRSVTSNKQIEDDKIRNLAIQNAVVHRVTLDKGIKPLERKLEYQLNKLMDTYRRREKEQQQLEAANEDEDEDEEMDEEFEDDDDDDGLNFRPNSKVIAGASRNRHTDKSSYSSDGKYRPPKISAALPPSMREEQAEGKKESRRRNLQSMDEYLQEVGDAPAVEASIGATIREGGREVKSRKQIEKDNEIKRYEEENFVRLPSSKSKESRQDKQKRLRNEFFGEDWSMFNNSGSINGEKSSGKGKKRRGGGGAWLRARKKMHE